MTPTPRMPAAVDVAAALDTARQARVERLDALALLAAVLQRPRSWLLAHGEAALDDSARARYAGLIARRADGVPLAYLLGEKEFFGLQLAVTPAVLVPRPDTETLVEWALDVLPPDRDAEVADLGTGSGAIALAIARHRPRARVCGVDASADALAVARANGERLGLQVQWLESNWFAALPRRRYTLVAANPPYVAEGDPHLAALTHEPQQALTSGADGLDAIRTIVASASGHLAPQGWLLLEHGYDQAPAVRALLDAAGFESVASRADLAGRPRCTGARWPGRCSDR